MAELDLVEERLISGTGLLRVSSLVEDTRYLRLNIDVIRQVPEPFKSFKWSPSRSRYCTLAFMRDGYVVQEEAVDYERRQFEWVADSSGQTLIAVKCMYKGLLETFVNLGNALVLVPFIVDNKIEDYENLRLLWDEVRVVCEGSTAVQVRLFALRYDDDCESSDERELPPPPPPLPQVPPGTPIGSISPPYDDDEVTSPSSLDEEEPTPEPEFPVGEAGLGYTITGTFTLRQNGVIVNNPNFTFQVFGPIELFGIADNLQSVRPGSAASGAFVIGKDQNGNENIRTSGFGEFPTNTVEDLRNVVITPTIDLPQVDL